ncbi:hypothetical protein PG993_006557 [Apiospora rasikravindrae]|uniref:CFEM domain-containing protein n=1 Tax=Apiospora rasikravindrae TaxID=990691 RepID=A0ABR1T863_9PEZI
MVILRNRWLPIAIAIVSFWSAQQAEAAGLLSLPFCVANCVQKSSTCKATDTKCLCKAARDEDKFLPDVAKCIRDECESHLSLGTLLIPLRASCLLQGLPIPNSAIREGNAVLKETASSSTTKGSQSTTAKATATTSTPPTTTAAERTTTAIPAAPPLTTATTASPASSTTAAATSTTNTTSPPPEQTPASSLSTSTRVTPSSSPALDGSKGDDEGDDKGSGLPTDPFAAPVEKGSSSQVGRQAPMFTGALLSSATVVLLVLAWS